MEQLIDFTNCARNENYFYGGGNGKKIAINYNDSIYMLKFPPTNKKAISYTNSCISEYISCHIFEAMGFDTQNTILGRYVLSNNKEKIVCACKDFTADNSKLVEFAKLKNSVIDSSNNGYGTDLIEVLESIEQQKLYPPEELLNFFWNMFIGDTLLGNFDRHNGNWGILINSVKGNRIAPIFDCGSCLYPQLSDEKMEEYLNNQDEIDKRLYIFPNSALKLNDKKINYYEFLQSCENQDCNEALLRIYPKIDLNKIKEIIENTPSISDVRKEFYKTMLQERYDKLLTPPYRKLQESLSLNNSNNLESEDDAEDYANPNTTSSKEQDHKENESQSSEADEEDEFEP